MSLHALHVRCAEAGPKPEVRTLKPGVPAPKPEARSPEPVYAD
jgi:hypothetical protein